MALFDETSPQLQYFQKPRFGKNTLLRKEDGSRTGASKALTAGLSWMTGLTPFGSEAGRSLDNLIQNGRRPDYLMDQEFYRNNVLQGENQANTLGTVVGGAADTIRGLAEEAASAMTGSITGGAVMGQSTGVSAKTTAGPATGTTPIKTSSVLSPTDPSVSFNQLLSGKVKSVMTPEQRKRNLRQSQSLMQSLPTQDPTSSEPWNFYSDTPATGFNFDIFKGARGYAKGGGVKKPDWFAKFKASKKKTQKKD